MPSNPSASTSTRRASAASPSTPATLPIDGFLASARKRTSPASTTDTKVGAKKAKASPAVDKANEEGTSGGSSKAVKAKGKAKKPKGKGKGKNVLKPDNRNLGTLELLDSTDDDDDLEVVSPAPPPADVGGGANAAAGSSDVKGKRRMRLEEEEWMGAGEEAVGAEDGEEGSEAARKKRRSCSSSPPAVLAAELADAQPPPVPVGSDEVVAGDEGVETKKEPETMELDDESADEVEIVGGGGMETCEACGELLGGLPKKKREEHDAACSSSSSTAAAPSTSTSSSLFAPISRLFSRSSAPTTSTSTSSPSSAPSASSSSSSGAKKPLNGVLSALPNAFTALMQGHTETAQWKAAEDADKKKGRLPKGEVRGVPFYKWIDGMEITVDAFKYGKIEGCKAYFLSHAHSDHYQNLSSSWTGGPIYASQTTINLIKLKLKVKDEYLFPLPLDQTVKVHGVDVTLIDANHCPGSVLFLFEGPHTDPKSPYSKTPNKIFRYLHCGDFRASPQHILHPSMSFPAKPPSRSSAFKPSQTSPDPLAGRTLKPLSAIYLDTTYLSPSYCFPAQDLVVQACADLVRERIETGEESVLWRADGREGERKGMKGWLKQGAVKDEEGVKDEDREGEDGLVEMTPLPEEREESQAPTPALGAGDGGFDGDEDEEAWLAVHGEKGGEDSQHQLGLELDEAAEGESQPAAKNGWEAMALDADDECCVNDAAAPAEEESKEGDAHPVAELDEEECEPKLKMEDLIGEVDVALSPADEEDVKPGAGEVKVEEGVKKEEGEEKPDVKPDVKPKTERLLVLIGTYSIGKERIVKAIAHALSTKVYCDDRKRALFLAQDDPDLHALLTQDPLEGQVHIGGLRDITREAMQDYLGKWNAKRVEGGFTKMIGLRPTGWTYRSETKDKSPSIAKILQLEQQRKFSPAGLYPQRDSTPQTMAFGVPYSEHSSFFELTCFCLSLDYVRIIPTVNVHTASSRSKMQGWIERWAAEKKRRKEQRLPRVVPYRSERYW